MYKHILFCVVTIDETVSIPDIKPFYCASDPGSQNISTWFVGRSFFLKFFFFFWLGVYLVFICGS